VLADVRFIGFPAESAAAGLFPCRRLALRTANRPLSLTSGSFSREAMPLQSSYNVNRRSLTFRRKAAYLGFQSSSRHHQSTVTRRRTSQVPLRSVLRFSQPLDGLPRAKALRAYFIPQPRSGFAPVQGLPPLCSHPSSSEGACPHVVSATSTHRPKPAAVNEANRLRGFDPQREPFLRIGVTRTLGRSPHQVHTPPGSSTTGNDSRLPRAKHS